MRTLRVVGSNPQLNFKDRWGWWPDGREPPLGAWNSVYSEWSVPVVGTFDLHSHASWSGVLSLGFGPDVKLPGADHGMCWMALEN